MPPIPSTLDEETGNSIASLQRRQHDLSTFQMARLRECKESLAVQQRYATELREDLDAFEEQIESLSLAVDDVERKSDRTVVQQLVDEFRTSARKIRKDMRSALLESKKAIDTQARSRRDELLRSASSTRAPTDEKATDDVLMQASNDVTDALRRTIGAMQGELERSVLSHQLLEKSTASLRATSAQHDTFSNVMDASKQLITALEKADWLDRLLVLAALAFFVLVVLFILKQRVLDRGVRLALWWTRFVPSFVPKARESMPDLKQVEEGSAPFVQTLLGTLSIGSQTDSAAILETTSAIMDAELVSNVIEDVLQSSSTLELRSDVADETSLVHVEL